MIFNHPETNQESPIPWDLETAKLLKYSRYMSLEQCDKCGAQPKGIYIETDECVQCVTKSFLDTWNTWLMGNPGKPDPFPKNQNEALSMMVDYYYKPLVCKGGPHLIKTHIKTGKCIACTYSKKEESETSKLMRDFPDMEISKEDAYLIGMNVYRTGMPCRKGHKSWRYISSGACVTCMHPQRISNEIVKEHQKFNIDQQIAMFIGYAYDGRKFIDPDGRKWNKTQFNSMFPAPAHYQLRDGGEPVFFASEAFIKNFTRQLAQ